ncbi:hypothetical protein F4819DRAFT_196579 [Hypoxylon fuscum]|nr:hypothetical protein F4819DRAFT_196579 [Hypoxylon fuscum]
MVSFLLPNSHWKFHLLLLFGILNLRACAVQNWPITAPVANEIVPVGQPYTIRWENNTEGPVSITLNYNEQPVVITSSTMNNGTFVWTPASVFAGDYDYYLSICDINLDSSECSVTYDGRFHISSPASSTSSTTSFTSSTAPSTSSTAESTSSTSATTSSTSATTSTTSSSSSEYLPTPTPTSNSDTPAELPVGSVVGIAVGTTVAVLALVAMAFWFYTKRKRKVSSSTGTGVSQIGEHLHTIGEYKPELSAENPTANDLMRLHAQFVGPAELHTWRGPYELSGNSLR